MSLAWLLAFSSLAQPRVVRSDCSSMCAPVVRLFHVQPSLFATAIETSSAARRENALLATCLATCARERWEDGCGAGECTVTLCEGARCESAHTVSATVPEPPTAAPSTRASDTAQLSKPDLDELNRQMTMVGSRAADVALQFVASHPKRYGVDASAAATQVRAGGSTPLVRSALVPAMRSLCPDALETTLRAPLKEQASTLARSCSVGGEPLLSAYYDVRSLAAPRVALAMLLKARPAAGSNAKADAEATSLLVGALLTP